MKAMGNQHVYNGCLLKKRARYFALRKEIWDSSSSRSLFKTSIKIFIKFCWQRHLLSPLGPSGGSLIVPACLNSAVSWVSSHAVFAFSSCSFYHPHHNKISLYCAFHSFFFFSSLRRNEGRIYVTPMELLKPIIEQAAKSILKSFVGKGERMNAT